MISLCSGSQWRHYLFLVDRIPAMPNARHPSCSRFTKSIAMTSFHPPGRQIAGMAKCVTSFLLAVYEIYHYGVNTSSLSTEGRQCQKRDIILARDIRNLSLWGHYLLLLDIMPAVQNANILPARALRNLSLWRHYLTLVDRMPEFPNARHISSSGFTKHIAIALLPPPGRQIAGIAKSVTSPPPGRPNSGHAKREISFLLGVYEIYRYDVTTSSCSTESWQGQTRDILSARDLRNISLWRQFFLLDDGMPVLPNARRPPCSWFT